MTLDELRGAMAARLPAEWEVSAQILDPAGHRAPVVTVRRPDGWRHGVSGGARQPPSEAMADAMAALLLAWAQCDRSAKRADAAIGTIRSQSQGE